jgi:hypothetical protein
VILTESAFSFRRAQLGPPDPRRRRVEPRREPARHPAAPPEDRRGRARAPRPRTARAGALERGAASTRSIANRRLCQSIHLQNRPPRDSAA